MIVGHEFLSGTFEDVSAVFKDIGTVTHGQRLGDVLFNKKNRNALLVDLFYQIFFIKSKTS